MFFIFGAPSGSAIRHVGFSERAAVLLDYQENNLHITLSDDPKAIVGREGFGEVGILSLSPGGLCS